MKDEIISFEIAKTAKDRGFDWGCNDCFNELGNLYSNGWCEILDTFFRDEDFFNSEIESEPISKKYYTAPTQNLLQRWLREEYNIHICIDYYELCEKYGGDVNSISNRFKIDLDTTFKTYESALEEGLKQGLMLIKND